jgi:hypothetical protein
MLTNENHFYATSLCTLEVGIDVFGNSMFVEHPTDLCSR